MELISILLMFSLGYVLNVYYISVFYHRGLTHGALRFPLWLEKFIGWSGPWVTGIDPKAWICMHRLHHAHSDTELDPHSPAQHGVFRLAVTQLRSYENVLRGLLKKKEPYVTLVRDLPFDVSFLNRHKLWAVPYVLHLAIGFAVGFGLGNPWLGIAYFLGMMSHPVQGWMVNAFGHHSGYRNFDTADNSRNNTLVAWLVVGEGYQNNHHARPNSARFAVKRWEVDMGYWLCRATVALGLARMPAAPEYGGERILAGT